MEKQKIEGKVLSCCTKNDGFDINLCTRAGEFKGIVIRFPKNVTKGEFSVLKSVKLGSEICFIIEQAQISKIILPDLGCSLSVQGTCVGVAFKESVFEKKAIRFISGCFFFNQDRFALQFRTKLAEKVFYTMDCAIQQSTRAKNFLQKCKAGDILLLVYDEFGKIRHVVNKTQAFEFA